MTVPQCFLDTNFFGETYRIEGKDITIVLDNDELESQARRAGSWRWQRVLPCFMPARRIFRPAGPRSKPERQRA